MDAVATIHHLLVAEDEEHLTRAICIAMRGLPYQVSVASTGTDALAAIRSFRSTSTPIDMLITDIQMPGLTGEVLIDAVRSEDSELPILVMTGFGDKELLIRLMRKGCQDYIDKPFTSDRFIETVLALITQTEKLRQAHWHTEQNTPSISNRDDIHNRYESLKASVETAAHMHRSLVDIHPELLNLPLAFFQRPWRTLGGDFAAAANTNSGVDIFVADVAGHDMAAAFHTVMLKTIFDSNRAQLQSGAAFFDLLNRSLIEMGNDSRLVTGVFIRVNVETATAEITSAAHPPVFHCHLDGSVEAISMSGHLLGVFPNAAFTSRSVSLSHGDRFFIFTDGLLGAEAVDGATGIKKQLSHDEVCSTLSHTRDQPLQNQIDAIQHAFENHCRNRFVDDTLLLGIEIPEVPCS